jgi:hypothetical protein
MVAVSRFADILTPVESLNPDKKGFDTAGGLKNVGGVLDISCRAYNHNPNWCPRKNCFYRKPFCQEKEAAVAMFSPRGPQYVDIDQGELGTCYFLAAVASIAHTHPDIISRMFVDRYLWRGDKPVYTTNWHIRGKWVKVSVDDKVPVKEDSMPFFVQVGRKREDDANWNFWVIALEKAWAKIFGSFKAVEYGYSVEAMKAITQAPVSMQHHKYVHLETLWKHLWNAHQMGFPTTAAHMSGGEQYGLAKSHAWSVLGVEVTQVPSGWRWRQWNGPPTKVTTFVEKRQVIMYNPWSAETYRGPLRDFNNDGLFKMPFDVFHKAFTWTTFAEVRRGYKISSKELPRGGIQQEFDASQAFEMKKAEVFSVELQLPGAATSWRPYSRSIPPECNQFHYQVGLKVCYTGPQGKWKAHPERCQSATDVLVLPFMIAKLQADQPGWYVLSVKVRFHPFKKQMQRYDPETNPTETDPTSWIQSIMIHVYSSQDITFLDAPEARTRLRVTVDPEDLVARGQKGANALAEHANKYHHGKCSSFLEDLYSLNNYAEIKSKGDDKKFPPTQESISADPDEICGDSAQGLSEKCSKYNTWKTFRQISAEAKK